MERLGYDEGEGYGYTRKLGASWVSAAATSSCPRFSPARPQSVRGFVAARLASAPVRRVPQLQEQRQALPAAHSRDVLAQDMRRVDRKAAAAGERKKVSLLRRPINREPKTRSPCRNAAV
jgi:hypothetical protein